MQMNSEGTRLWRRLTANSVGQQIAIVLDNRVYSAPVVNEEIPSGSSIISGNFEIQEAQDLANILEAGALPAPTRIVEEAVVGPTLGRVAIGQGSHFYFGWIGISGDLYDCLLRQRWIGSQCSTAVQYLLRFRDFSPAYDWCCANLARHCRYCADHRYGN